jgi:hypothetical protein
MYHILLTLTLLEDLRKLFCTFPFNTYGQDGTELEEKIHMKYVRISLIGKKSYTNKICVEKLEA